LICFAVVFIGTLFSSLKICKYNPSGQGKQLQPCFGIQVDFSLHPFDPLGLYDAFLASLPSRYDH
jgi:hypothetical protein